MSSYGMSFAHRKSRWMEGQGPSQDVVISSRIRLARNLKDYPFPPMMTEDKAREVLNLGCEISEALNHEGSAEYSWYPLEKLDSMERQVLIEKHLISPQLLRSAAISGVIISRDEAVSIMVNEEDHFRIQCLFSGMDLEAAWSLADRLDSDIAGHVTYAFDDEFGYLTTCPTNLGTGLRGSVMTHLPGLVLTEQLSRIVSGLSKVGAVVRGLYGEGSQAEGSLYQISNHVTLGHSESEIVDNLNSIVSEVVRRERSAREALLNRNRVKLEDRVYRAYGILTNARSIAASEAIELLSLVRLGVVLGILTHIPIAVFPELIVGTRRASIQQKAGAHLDSDQRDLQRANLIRKRLLAE